MKKIFTTLALIGAVAGAANAQKTCIVKALWGGPAADGGYPVSCTDSFQAAYGFVNLGPGTIETTDTFAFNDFESDGVANGWIGFSNVAVAPGDTFNVQVWNSHINRINWLLDTATFDEKVAPFAAGPYYAFTRFFGFYTKASGSWAPRTDIIYDDSTDTNVPAIGFLFLMPDCATGIANGTENSLSINAYPNPVSDKLNVTVSLDKAGAASLRVLDVMGREVLTQSFGMLNAGSQNLSIDVNNLPNGFYTVEIFANEQRGISKFNVRK